MMHNVPGYIELRPAKCCRSSKVVDTGTTGSSKVVDTTGSSKVVVTGGYDRILIRPTNQISTAPNVSHSFLRICVAVLAEPNRLPLLPFKLKTVAFQHSLQTYP